MRLYSRNGATSVTHGGHTYEPDSEGAFNLPEELGRQQHSFHVNGRPLWETDLERNQRLVAEEMERRKDPSTLLGAVEQILAAARATQPAQPVEAAPASPAPAKPSRPRKPAAAE